MQTLLIDKPYSAKIVEQPIPLISNHQVLIKVKLSGICASDLLAYRGAHAYRVPPVITGHEAVGEIVELGLDVKNFSIGDRVVVEPHRGCGHCRYCHDGDYNLCTNKEIMGTSEWIGAFAEYIAAPESCLLRLPTDMSWEKAVLIEPLAVGAHAAHRIPIAPGSNVAVFGAGPIGLATVAALSRMGLNGLLVTDIRDENLQHALNLGANLCVNPLKQNLDHVVGDKFPGNLDATFIAVSVDEVMEDAFRLTKRKGQVVLIASYGRKANVHFGELQLYERTLVGTGMYTRRDFIEAMDIAAEKEYLEKIVTMQISIEEAPKILAQLSGGEIKDCLKAVISWS